MTQVNDYIYTDTRTDREAMIDTLSDLSKEVYGFRWRYNYDEMTDEDMQREYEFLSKENERVFQEHMEAEERADREFEVIIKDWMERYNISRKDAIRWMMQAQDFGNAEMYSEKENVEHFLYNQRLSSKKIQEELKALNFNNTVNFGY